MTTSVVAFFCEDVRQEAEGKFTLIGIYPDNMSLQGSVPEGQSIALPKMCVFARISFDPHDDTAIAAKMLNPDGSETSFGALDQKAITEAKNSALQQKNPIAGVNLIVQSTPFLVPAFGRYLLEITVGKETFVAGSLNISSAKA
jgi:hypothetical protein